MLIIVKGGTSRKRRSNAADARHLIQEARERRVTGEPMSRGEYLKRMNEVCRDTPGDKCKDLRKARLQDMEYRKEAGY